MDLWWLVGAALVVIAALLLRSIALLRRLRRRVKDDREVSVRVEERVGEATRWYHEAQRFRLVFNYSSNVIALLATNGTVLEANGLLLNLAGVGEDKVVGRRLWETPPYDLAGLPERVEEVAASRSRAGIEAELPAWDGRAVRMAFGLTPVLDDRGCVEYVIVEGAALTA